MNEPSKARRLIGPRVTGLVWPLLLVLSLAISILVDRVAEPAFARLDSPDRTRASQAAAAVAGLPPRPLVLVGMDPDFGTYPEIRPAVRALLEELLELDAQLALVSYTPEGRALAAAEVDRLVASGVDAETVLDLGFVAGAEAGLVLSVTELVPPDLDAPLARTIRVGGGGMAAFDLAIVVGGTDFGPRSWVEQVATRLPQLPLVAVVPTFAHPELEPYLRTGQLAALLGTVRDGAAYHEDVAGELPAGRAAVLGPRASSLAMLVGMLVALGVIVSTLYRAPRLLGRPPEAEPEDSP